TQSGNHNLAQIGSQHIDLALVQDGAALEGPITEAWIEDNVSVDRQVDFGSQAYFALAADPEARAFLQAGNNVLFRYQGEVIQVVDPEALGAMPDPQGDHLDEEVQRFQSIMPAQPGLPGAQPPAPSHLLARLWQAVAAAIGDFVRNLRP
ncbi:MAG: hypothetical protein JXC32_08355, partial [Anaerolineae bacterium]|nr:hypothetical protein [Anaerolineae bacterium]